MIAKKNSRYDLESKRSAFFQLGLFAVGSITLAAFSYSDPMMRADEGNQVAREIIPIVWDQTQPIEEKQDDVLETPLERTENQSTVDASGLLDERSRSTSNSNTNPQTGITVDLFGLVKGPKLTIGNNQLVKIDLDEIEEIVDKEAQYVGGYAELQKFIGTRISYPEEAIRLGEEGIVYMSFVVEKDGSVSNVAVERGVSNSLDREAKRIITAFPEWIPGEIRMQRVRTRVRIPINFVLSK